MIRSLHWNQFHVRLQWSKVWEWAERGSALGHAKKQYYSPVLQTVKIAKSPQPSQKSGWNGHHGHSSATAVIAEQVTSTGHSLKWEHFDILARGKSDTHCKIKETFLIRDLKPALNENISSNSIAGRLFWAVLICSSDIWRTQRLLAQQRNTIEIEWNSTGLLTDSFKVGSGSHFHIFFRNRLLTSVAPSIIRTPTFTLA